MVLLISEDSSNPVARFFTLGSLSVIALLHVLCLLKSHPPSCYMTDAKWCIFGIWLGRMSYWLYEISLEYGWRSFASFPLSLNCGFDSVVCCWILMLFQCRLQVQDPFAPVPRRSMYGIYAYIGVLWGVMGVNVSIYIPYMECMVYIYI